MRSSILSDITSRCRFCDFTQKTCWLAADTGKIIKKYARVWIKNNNKQRVNILVCITVRSLAPSSFPSKLVTDKWSMGQTLVFKAHTLTSLEKKKKNGVCMSTKAKIKRDCRRVDQKAFNPNLEFVSPLCCIRRNFKTFVKVLATSRQWLWDFFFDRYETFVDCTTTCVSWHVSINQLSSPLCLSFLIHKNKNRMLTFSNFTSKTKNQFRNGGKWRQKKIVNQI